MDNKLVSLSYDKIELLEGEVNERLPRYNKDLIAHFPCDNTLNNAIPDIEIYVENNTLKTKGIISNPIIENTTTIENNMIKFDGTVDSYMLLNKDLLNGVDDFSVEIDFIDNAAASINTSWLLSCINTTVGYNNLEFGISIDEQYNMANFQILNAESESDKEHDYDKGYYHCSKLSTINKGMINKLKISRINGCLICTINDEFQYFYRIYKDFNISDIIIGQLSNKSSSVTTHNFNANNSFNGYISKIVINRCEKLFSYDANVTDLGTFSSVTNTNLETKDFSSYAWNASTSTSFISSITETENNIEGNKIRRVSISNLDTTPSAVTNVKTGYYRYGIQNTVTRTFNANTKYCCYVLYRPISHKDMTCTTTTGNIGGWLNGNQGVPIGNGWYLAYKYRDGSYVTTVSDRLYFNFYPPSYKEGEDIIVEVSPIFLVKDQEVPSYISYKGQETITEKANAGDTKLLKYINPYINNFTVSFDLIVTSHSTPRNSPNIIWLGKWTSTKTEDWLGIYRGVGWDAGANIFHIDMISKEKVSQTGISAVSCIQGHEYNMTLSYDKSTTTITCLIYDKTDNNIVYENSLINPNFILNNFESANLNINTNDFIKNVSFYNKALILDEMKINTAEKFSIQSNGNIVLESLKELDINNNNAYIVPLGKDGTSLCGRLNTLENVQLAPIEDGSLTGTITSSTILDLMRNKSYSEIAKGTHSWDYDKHKDALLLEGWQSGYTNTVTSPEIGYHSKIVLEGINGRPAIKFIDCNSEFGLANRYMRNYKTITTSELPLAVTNTISVYFKAKSKVNGSKVRIVINRKSLSSGTYLSSIESKTFILNNEWSEYYFTFTIDSDWDTSSTFYLYIEETGNSFDTVTLVSDVMLVKNANSPELLTSEILYNLSTKKIQYNLSNSIGLDWTKPWQIMYKKKFIDSKINSLDALGSYNNSTANPYLYIGNYVGKFTVSYSNNGVTKISQATVSPTIITNEWVFISIRYDGIDKLTANVIGRNVINSSNTGVAKITAPFLSDFGFDLSLGTYQSSDTAQVSGGSLIKDLVILKNECLSEEETIKRGQLLMSYKDNILNTNIKLIEK